MKSLQHTFDAHSYPKYSADPTVFDTYFGTNVPDPYRALEDMESSATKTWVAAQNALSSEWLRACSGKEQIASYLEHIWNHPRTSVPDVAGERYFFTHNDGLDKQPKLYVYDGHSREKKVLVDPLTLDETGTTSIQDFYPSPDGRVLAYSLSDGGSDLADWYFLDVASGKKLGDRLRHTKFTPLAWTKDSARLYYSRHPEHADGSTNDQVPPSIYVHQLGTDQGADREVINLHHPRRNPFPKMSDDGKYLLIQVFDGYEQNALYYCDIESGSHDLVRLFDAWDGLYSYVGNRDSLFFIHTTQGAPRGRVVGVDIRHPERSSWKTLISESAHALDEVRQVGESFYVTRLVDASSQVDIFSLSGEYKSRLPLPGIGTVEGFYCWAEAKETFFSFTTFDRPPQLYRLTVLSGAIEEWQMNNVTNIESICTVTRIETKSADGTPIRAFVLTSPRAQNASPAPTLLYGYGGFGYSVTPWFSARFAAWVAMGGTVVVANIRGGGEEGEAWHLAATKLNKQRSFDDFSAVARYLVSAGYTTPAQLALIGGSNGGLLVGAVVEQYPDICAAAVAQVGLMDMVRYHRACANAKQWGSEYGISEEHEADFKNLLAYSPYHNVKPGVVYPALLATTADHDDRVVPWHSYKWIARLQAVAQEEPNILRPPLLLRVDTRAGHGAGKSVNQSIEETTDILLFLKEIIPGLTPPPTLT